MEAVLLFLIAVAVIAVTAVLFCAWTVVAVIRMLCRAIFGTRRPAFKEPTTQSCHNRHCQCGNPAYARFCRRCGQPLPALMRLVDARAA